MISKATRAVLLLGLVACSHTEILVTDIGEPRGPFDDPPGRLTFHVGNDYNPSWTPDGQHILYFFSPAAVISVNAANERDERCLAMIPGNGGSQVLRLCDTRATHVDSADMFLGAAFRPNGELSFLQGSSAFSGLNPIHFTMWLVDTAAPFLRRKAIAEFPKVVGDSTVGALSEVEWIDQNTFLAIGSRLLITSRQASTVKDTIFRPVFIVRGTMTGETLALTQVSGTEGAAHWTRDPTGNILFVGHTLRSGVGRTFVDEERFIKRIPQTGGTAETFAVFPQVGSVRTLQCRGTKCFVVTGARQTIDPDIFTVSTAQWLDPVSGAFTQLPFSASQVNGWDTPTMSPDGTRIVYRNVGTGSFSNGQLFVVRVP